MDLPRLVSHQDILRGRIFYVALPHTEGRPFKFLQKENEDSNSYRVIEKSDGFEGTVLASGQRRADQQEVVVGIKLRPCLIIQKDQYNQNERYPFVVVLPIATLTKKHKSRPIFQRLIEKNDLDQFYYLGNDCYITINDPHRVYKNTLFYVEGSLKIDEENFDMDELMKRFAECFDVKELRAMDTT